MNTTRRQFLKHSGISALNIAAAFSAVSAFADSRTFAAETGQNRKLPNIVMITCHDLGQHLGCYGVKSVNSDNIDKLAAKGVRFANYFATSPTCTPSRSAIHTGRYQQSNGLMGLCHEPWGWEINDDEKHTASYMKDAGYDTYLIGLQHLTIKKDVRSFGYDHVLSEKHIAVETVAAAKELFQKADEDNKPFFAKIGFFEVHRTTGSSFSYPPDSERGVEIPHFLQDTPVIREDLAKFQGTIKAFDGFMGQILDSLENSPAGENTLVIFTADHGIPYIGAKWTLFDPGLQTPLIMYQPGTEMSGGKVYTQMMSNVDLLPTVLDLLGQPIPERIQGMSFKPVLMGQTEGELRSEIYADHISHALRDNTSRCIRTKEYKLIRYFEPGRNIQFPTDADPQKVAQHTERPKRVGKRPVVQLYNLKNDPHERNNLSQKPEYKKVVDELSNKLWKWMEDVNDPLLKGPLVTPYYLETMEDYKEYKTNK